MQKIYHNMQKGAKTRFFFFFREFLHLLINKNIAGFHELRRKHQESRGYGVAESVPGGTLFRGAAIRVEL